MVLVNLIVLDWEVEERGTWSSGKQEILALQSRVVRFSEACNMYVSYLLLVFSEVRLVLLIYYMPWLLLLFLPIKIKKC
jgi:hypothetical protein